MLETWLLILTVTLSGNHVVVGKYTSEQLCKDVAVAQVGHFGPFSIFERYDCMRVEHHDDKDGQLEK